MRPAGRVRSAVRFDPNSADPSEPHRALKKEITFIPFPNVVWIIIINEFCERFGYYGLRGTLTLYLSTEIGLTQNQAIIIYHTYTCVACACPILGAILADGYIGRYKTILYLSMVHCLGNITIAIAASQGGDPVGLAFTGISLCLVAIGTGGIKPCVSSLGGDQFVLPQQQQQLEVFFSHFYMAISTGSFLATVIIPLFRSKVNYSLAFGFPALLMAIAILTFFLARRHYKMYRPSGVVVTSRWIRCITIGTCRKLQANNKVDHFLDRTRDRFEEAFIDDVKITLSLILIFLPFPMFWALYDQQASTWIIQATEMDGQLTTVLLLPDQMQTLNTFLILIVIPLLDYVIYPALAQMGWLTTCLQRMTAGGVFAAVAFLCAGIVSVIIYLGSPDQPYSAYADIRIYNVLKCDMVVHSPPLIEHETIGYLQYKKFNVEAGGEDIVFVVTGCESRVVRPISYKYSLFYGETLMCYLNFYGFTCKFDDFKKERHGRAKFRIIADRPGKEVNFLKFFHKLEDFEESRNTSDTGYTNLRRPGAYMLNDDDNKEYKFLMGGIYTILASLRGKDIKEWKVHEVSPPSNVHLVWQIPQIIFITIAEAMLCPTALRFAYTQAPASMKSLVTSIYYFSEALGNLMVVIIHTLPFFFERYDFLFLLNAVLMLLSVGLFVLVARKYHYVNDRIV